MINISLKNKKALVCGASQGIGKAIAVELAALGASCMLLARNEEKLKSVLSELISIEGQSHDYQVVDFTDIDAFKSIIQRLADVHNFDIIINNTGGPAAGLIFDADAFAFENAFRQHLVCNHIIAQAIVPGMKERQWGRIINIISTSVRIPLDNLGVSNTIRAAVASWSKTLSNELAQDGIYFHKPTNRSGGRIRQKK
jgi:3-oxoacyl-[acyl-carrier protein] reductase